VSEHEERLRELIDVRAASPWSQVHWAVESGDAEGLARYLSEGADPEEICHGFTLLTHAIELEGDSALQTREPLSSALTAIILAYGADPELPCPDGETPLQVADQYDHAPARRLLERFIAMKAR
jgi:hypothetical protein